MMESVSITNPTKTTVDAVATLSQGARGFFTCDRIVTSISDYYLYCSSILEHCVENSGPNSLKVLRRYLGCDSAAELIRVVCADRPATTFSSSRNR